MYLLPPLETAETCQTWLRMRNTNGRYTLIFEETMSDGPFIISPSISFEVSVRILGGLMALGYSIGAMIKRECVSLSFVVEGSAVEVKLDNVEGLGEYVQVQGENRAAVAAAGRALGLEDSYIPQSYIEEVQLQQMVQQFREHDEDIIRIAKDSHNGVPKLLGGGGGNGNGNGHMNGGMNGFKAPHPHQHPMDAIFNHRAMSPGPAAAYEMPAHAGFSPNPVAPPPPPGVMEVNAATNTMAAESIRIQSQLDNIRHEARDIMAALTRVEMLVVGHGAGAGGPMMADAPGRGGNGSPRQGSTEAGEDLAAFKRLGIGSEGWFAVGVASGSALLGVVLGAAISLSLRTSRL